MSNISIGIDPGKHTGMGVYDTTSKKLVEVHTLLICQAMKKVLDYHNAGALTRVTIEDARMATMKRKGANQLARAQGAGSIKRDCTIWEDYCRVNNIPYRMVRPNKQLNVMCENVKSWRSITKWLGRTSHHARIGSMLAM